MLPCGPTFPLLPCLYFLADRSEIFMASLFPSQLVSASQLNSLPMGSPVKSVSLTKEWAGASVSGAAAVQHKCAIQCLRQVLLWPTLPGGGQQPQLSPGTSQQRQGSETRGEQSTEIMETDQQVNSGSAPEFNGLVYRQADIRSVVEHWRWHHPTSWKWSAFISSEFWIGLQSSSTSWTQLLFCFDFQAISRLCDDKYKDLRKLAKKRSVSADNLSVVRWCPAIIS